MNFKVGDRVRFHKFNGRITSINFYDESYPILAQFNGFTETFTIDGRLWKDRDEIELVKIDLDKKINKILSL